MQSIEGKSALKVSPLSTTVVVSSHIEDIHEEGNKHHEEDAQDQSESDDDEFEDDQANYPGAEDQSSMVTLRGEVSAEAAKGFPSFNYKYFNRNVSASPYWNTLLLSSDHTEPGVCLVYAESGHKASTVLAHHTISSGSDEIRQTSVRTCTNPLAQVFTLRPHYG